MTPELSLAKMNSLKMSMVPKHSWRDMLNTSPKLMPGKTLSEPQLRLDKCFWIQVTIIFGTLFETLLGTIFGTTFGAIFGTLLETL